MLANFATASLASSAANTMTVNVGGTQIGPINIVAGDYTDNPPAQLGIDKFIDANKSVFTAKGLSLSKDNGNLVISTISGGSHLTVRPG